MTVYDKIRASYQIAKKIQPFQGHLIAFDPGETTGVSHWEVTPAQVILKRSTQVKTWPIDQAVKHLAGEISQTKPDAIVFESYQVYEWKKDEHSWSQIPTVQVIGCLQTLCIQQDIPYFTQTAQIAKGFVTDEKLKDWGFYERGQRHARDSMRHALYFLLFGPKKDA